MMRLVSVRPHAAAEVLEARRVPARTVRAEHEPLYWLRRGTLAAAMWCRTEDVELARRFERVMQECVEHLHTWHTGLDSELRRALQQLLTLDLAQAGRQGAG